MAVRFVRGTSRVPIAEEQTMVTPALRLGPNVVVTKVLGEKPKGSERIVDAEEANSFGESSY